ncbi:uncharacterized protein LOC123884682 [Trifolium pratense]|uniref:Uncharacterized protein n=1 Tax=Trifolium pratense TaxID=57577 RepID=A0ACB0L0B3_TRIPR|nr:uncharacterized protein LOC123884682 [Trifolium pratense]XP_045789801.1 uncharacterized protein LOC123884682 [Trifolium pratense]XP_045789802.1 uncharacterized protein LOC123884682 [Trifolium pratense]CAJ2662466.1 unnamed protein product [Trifolium pratense]
MGNNSSLFIFFSTVLFIAFVLQKQHQLSSSLDQLSSSLDQLNSKVLLLESIIKKSDHQLRSKEEDIALIKKMILEKEEVKTVQQNIVYKIDLDQALSFGRGALIKYKNSFKDNAIQGLTRVRNWLGDSAENDKNEDKQEVIIQENLKLPQEEGTCQ